MDSRRFRGLVAIQQRISEHGGGLQAILEAIVDERSVMPQVNGVVIELRDGDQLYYAAASGSSADLIGLRLPLSSSLSGMSILTGQPLQCTDSETDPRVNLSACRRVGLRSMIVVPIPFQGHIVGVLKYHAPTPSAFSEEDMQIAHLLVGPIAVGFSSMAQADAQRASSELQDVVRLKEQFVATVTNELRAPLSSISGVLAMLNAGTIDLPESARPLIEIATRKTGRLTRLVDDLFDLDQLDGRKLEYRIERTDIGAVLVDVVEQASAAAAATGVQLTLSQPRTPVLTMTDGDRLFQAVGNLVSNGVKASPAGSRVAVEMFPGVGDVRIRVTDQGPGIPPEFRPRMFDRFSQSPLTENMPEAAGTGLGLAIAKGIVEQLGGALRLDESYTQGAAFDISLPLK